jgi:hypothetical protein
MNPAIPTDYPETGRWLQGFASSHAKREDPRLEIEVLADEREGRSYGLRLRLGARRRPAASEPPIELAYAEVAEGRTRFAWCETLAHRLREEGRRLVAADRAGGSRSA